jgi:hypothetical protein
LQYRGGTGYSRSMREGEVPPTQNTLLLLHFRNIYSSIDQAALLENRTKEEDNEVFCISLIDFLWHFLKILYLFVFATPGSPGWGVHSYPRENRIQRVNVISSDNPGRHGRCTRHPKSGRTIKPDRITL